MTGQRLGPRRAVAELAAAFSTHLPSGGGGGAGARRGGKQQQRQTRTLLVVDEIDVLITRDQNVSAFLLDHRASLGTSCRVNQARALSLVRAGAVQPLRVAGPPRLAPGRRRHLQHARPRLARAAAHQQVRPRTRSSRRDVRRASLCLTLPRARACWFVSRSRLASSKLVFNPYNSKNLETIVQERLGQGRQDVVNEVAIRFAARKVRGRVVSLRIKPVARGRATADREKTLSPARRWRGRAATYAACLRCCGARPRSSTTAGAAKACHPCRPRAPTPRTSSQ